MRKNPAKIFIGLTAFLVALPSLTSCALLTHEPDRYAGLRPGERRIAMAMDQKDLVVGMNRENVRSVWGQPVGVDVAGESDEGNERWTYLGRLSNPAFQEFGQRRVVYFEQGRVIGWDRQ